jgi:hypothetical protein
MRWRSAAWRVAGAYRGADIDVDVAKALKLAADAGQRRFEVDGDVVGQGLEWRDVNHGGLPAQAEIQTVADQPVDHRQECGQGLAGSRGRSNQAMATVTNGWPGLDLRRRGCGKLPCANQAATAG